MIDDHATLFTALPTAFGELIAVLEAARTMATLDQNYFRRNGASRAEIESGLDHLLHMGQRRRLVWTKKIAAKSQILAVDIFKSLRCKQLCPHA